MSAFNQWDARSDKTAAQGKDTSITCRAPQKPAQTLTAPCMQSPVPVKKAYSADEQAQILSATSQAIRDLPDDGLAGLRDELIWTLTNLAISPTMFHVPQLPTGRKDRRVAFQDKEAAA